MSESAGDLEFMPSFDQMQHVSVLREHYDRNDPRIEMRGFLERLYDDEEELNIKIQNIFDAVEELKHFNFLNPQYLSYAYYYKDVYNNQINPQNLKDFFENKIGIQNNNVINEVMCPTLIRYLKIISVP